MRRCSEDDGDVARSFRTLFEHPEVELFRHLGRGGANERLELAVFDHHRPSGLVLKVGVIARLLVAHLSTRFEDDRLRHDLAELTLVVVLVAHVSLSLAGDETNVRGVHLERLPPHATGSEESALRRLHKPHLVDEIRVEDDERLVLAVVGRCREGDDHRLRIERVERVLPVLGHRLVTFVTEDDGHVPDRGRKDAALRVRADRLVRSDGDTVVHDVLHVAVVRTDRNAGELLLDLGDRLLHDGGRWRHDEAAQSHERDEADHDDRLARAGCGHGPRTDRRTRAPLREERHLVHVARELEDDRVLILALLHADGRHHRLAALLETGRDRLGTRGKPLCHGAIPEAGFKKMQGRVTGATNVVLAGTATDGGGHWFSPYL